MCGQASTAKSSSGMFGEQSTDAREFGAEELMALGSACHLVSAYFDGMNPKIGAPPKRGKK